VGLVVPEPAGALDGIAVRVPVEDGSLTDLALVLTREASADEINAAFEAAANGPLNGILRVSEAPIVSRDVIGDPSSCIFDPALTQANGTLAKVFGWYDNEWGYTNRLLDLTALVADTSRSLVVTAEAGPAGGHRRADRPRGGPVQPMGSSSVPPDDRSTESHGGDLR
jgi:glyceraldehyde-3-phosphate dehydrogenase/erythrose-4-phosphate dehydrogenase